MPYDCSQITERLYIGANISTPQDIVDIHALGITHVIDCNTDDERQLFAGTAGSYVSGIALLSDPTEDDGAPKPASWFSPGIDFGVGALSHPGFKLLTHCAAGVNRGPSMGYAILRALGWWSLDALN